MHSAELTTVCEAGKMINWWMITAGFLYAGASYAEGVKEHWLLLGVYTCYALSSGLLAFVGGK